MREHKGTCLITADPATSSKRDGCGGGGSHTSSSAACPCTASGLCTILEAARDPLKARGRGGGAGRFLCEQALSKLSKATVTS